MDKRNVKLILMAGIILTVVTAMAGCMGTSNIDVTPTPDASNPNALHVGISPSDTSDVKNAYAPLKDYLQKQTGYEVEFYVGSDDDAVANELKSKKVDVAFTGPISYGMAYLSEGYGDPATRGKGELFGISADANGSTTRYAYLIGTPEVAQALGITTPFQGQAGMTKLTDALNNHKNTYSFSWSDTADSYGYSIPRIAMGNAQFDLNSMKSTGFGSSQDETIKAVSQKTTDLAAVSSTDYDSMIASGQISPSSVVVLWVSDPVPNPMAYYRSDLPQDEKDKIKNAILNAPADVLKPTGLTQYKAADDNAYASIPTQSKSLEVLLIGS